MSLGPPKPQKEREQKTEKVKLVSKSEKRGFDVGSTNQTEPVVPTEPGRGQAEFMRTEKPGQDSNDRSGAV